MTEINIRPARPEDGPPVTELIARAYAPMLSQLPGMPDVTAGVAEDITTRHVWVAQHQDAITGVLIASPRADHLLIMNLAVDPTAQGKGIARALLQHAETLARAQGVQTLKLKTHTQMRSARALYQRLGWQETGQSGVTVSVERDISDYGRD